MCSITAIATHYKLQIGSVFTARAYKIIVDENCVFYSNTLHNHSVLREAGNPVSFS